MLAVEYEMLNALKSIDGTLKRIEHLLQPQKNGCECIKSAVEVAVKSATHDTGATIRS